MIRVLPKEVSDKIAAGEVIENPVSIVKELVENSIDAGATSITCEIKKGGKEEIRITDNGSGIPSEQVETAFLRHATSKIEKAEDLKHLGTLGFRGEALASIAAVSRTELVTKTREEKTGTRIIIHGGETINRENVGCPEGTTIIVKDLFYNMPARGKFLKSEAAETGKVIDMMSRLAITRPDIKFALISNGRNVFTTTGNGDLKAAIISVYKDREYKELVEVGNGSIDESENDGNLQSGTVSSVKVHGFVSRPSFTRSNRRSQIYFVNGRAVKNSAIEKGIDLGYRERVFEGRYPIAFLFIDIDPEKLDVNIHPNKREVRFNDDIPVITAVENAVLSAITSKEAVVQAGDSLTEKQRVELNLDSNKTRSLDSKGKFDVAAAAGNKNEQQVNIREYLKEKKSDNYDFSSESEQFYVREGSGDSSPKVEALPKGETPPDENFKVEPSPVENFKIEPSPVEKFDFEDLNFGDTIFGTYITATDSENFYLFDQHAAHERVNYEKFVNTYLSEDKESQILLTPFTVDAPLDLQEVETQWLDAINKMGYSVSPFGENTYIVREIPTFMTMAEAEGFLKTFIDEYNNDRRTNNTVVIDKLITKACKSSIKAHDYIKKEEIDALIEELKLCNNPYSCPHGRPTFIKFSLYDIEKMFKRIQ